MKRNVAHAERRPLRGPDAATVVCDEFTASNMSRRNQVEIRADPGEIHLPVIKESNLRKDGWGDLHGPAFKSAITRHAAGFSNICPISS